MNTFGLNIFGGTGVLQIFDTWEAALVPCLEAEIVDPELQAELEPDLVAELEDELEAELECP